MEIPPSGIKSVTKKQYRIKPEHQNCYQTKWWPENILILYRIYIYSIHIYWNHIYGLRKKQKKRNQIRYQKWGTAASQKKWIPSKSHERLIEGLQSKHSRNRVFYQPLQKAGLYGLLWESIFYICNLYIIYIFHIDFTYILTISHIHYIYKSPINIDRINKYG